MIKIHHLGIDFGSSKTSIVGFSRDRENEKFVLFYDKNAPSSKAFQTSAAVKRNGNRVCGYTFFRKADDVVWGNSSSEEKWVAVDRLKESLVEINAFSDNNEKISRECAERFFETIYDALIDSYYEDPGSGASEGYDFSELSSIVYGYPEYYTPNASIAYQEFFEEILRNVFTGEMDLKIQGVPEPELAAYAYHYAHRGERRYVEALHDKEKVLVLDFGGHTLDIMVMMVQETSSGIQLQQYTRPGSDSYFVLLGKDITKNICEEIYGTTRIDPSVETAKCELLKYSAPDSRDGQTVGKIYPMRTVCDGYDSFQLCYYSDWVPSSQRKKNVALVGVYDVDGVDLKTVYEKAYRQIKDYLKQNNVDPESIQHVLFAGGGSCIADLRHYIMERLRNGRPSNSIHVCGYFDKTAQMSNMVDCFDGEAMNVSFGNAVALGAALVSAGMQSRSWIQLNNPVTGNQELTAQFVLRDLDNLLQRILDDDQRGIVNRFYEDHHLI